MTIHGAAQDALAEMRQLLGVLREEDDTGSVSPQPGLAELPALVERTQSAGVAVTLEVAGEPRVLPTGLDLSAYRIAQEALTNVVRHAAGAPATLRIDWRPAALAITVTNPVNGHTGVRDRGGHGLVGMRERARLHDGTLRAGPEDGHFVVQAVLPL
jgi:signal transduction histidine kinase